MKNYCGNLPRPTLRPCIDEITVLDAGFNTKPRPIKKKL